MDWVGLNFRGISPEIRGYYFTAAFKAPSLSRVRTVRELPACTGDADVTISVQRNTLPSRRKIWGLDDVDQEILEQIPIPTRMLQAPRVNGMSQ